jgi:hypothetical protein
MPELLARYEFKYLITDDQMARIREWVRPYLEPDEYGDGGSYWVNSLYLDTYDWRLGRDTIDGTKNRYKIRMRCYAFDDTPVFCEIKGRVGSSIVKSRALIPRESAEAVATNSPVADGTVRAAKPGHQRDLDRFRNIVDVRDLRPRLWVRYFREAYVSPFGEGARLTFDQVVQVQVPSDPFFEPPIGLFHPVALEQPTILELKFNGASPHWMRYLVRAFDLKRISVAKYVQGALQVGRAPFNTSVEHPWIAW